MVLYNLLVIVKPTYTRLIAKPDRGHGILCCFKVDGGFSLNLFASLSARSLDCVYASDILPCSDLHPFSYYCDRYESNKGLGNLD
jgi:hypothetical protein